MRDSYVDRLLNFNILNYLTYGLFTFLFGISCLTFAYNVGNFWFSIFTIIIGILSIAFAILSIKSYSWFKTSISKRIKNIMTIISCCVWILIGSIVYSLIFGFGFGNLLFIGGISLIISALNVPVLITAIRYKNIIKGPL